MTIRFLLAFILIFILSSCSREIDNSRLRVDVIEDNPRPFVIGVLPLPEGSTYLRAATAQGLVIFDREGHVVPALASRWIVTDDGLSYIFRLKKIRWNNGPQLSSSDVANILNNRIRELRKSRFAPELTLIDRAVSMTGKVIEIRLKAPVPNLLELLAQPEFGIVRRGTGSGPMQATKSDNYMQLRMKIFNEQGDPALEDGRLTLRISTAAMAFARFNAGVSDFITGGRFQHIPLFEAAKPKNATMQFDPVPGLFGLLFVQSGPFLSQPQNREAIAMAIDRPKLLSSFEIIAWSETFTIVPETMQNHAPVPRPNWAGIRMEDRHDRAREVITQWTEGNGSIRPLRIAMPDGPGARIFFAQIRSDLAAIGLRVERVSHGDQADIRLIDRVADMSTPAWYLSQLSCDATSICDADADQLVAQARMATNRDNRVRLLGEAEVKLQATRNFIPIANPLRWSLTHDGLLGFSLNPRGRHLLQYLGREPT